MLKLTNLKMRNKLLALLFLPFLCLLILAFSLIAFNVNKVFEMNKEKELGVLANTLDNVNDSILALREKVFLYILDKNLDLSQEVSDENQKLEDSLTALKLYTDKSDLVINEKPLRLILQKFIDNASLFHQKLEQINFLNLTPNEAINYFKNIESQYLEILQKVSQSSNDIKIARALEVYQYVIKQGNVYNMQFLILAQALHEGKFSPELYENYIKMISTEENYNEMFFQNAFSEQKEIYKNIVKGEPLVADAKFRNHFLEQVKEGNLDVDLDSLRKVYDAKQGLLSEAVDRILDTITQRGNALIKDARNNLIWIIALVSAITLCTIFLTYFIVKSITGPLHQAVELANQVGEGNLEEIKINTTRNDEIGELEKSLQKMVKGLKNTTLKLQEEVEVLATSSSEILASITDVSSGTTETATAVTETTTTVEELRQTGQVSTDKAKDVQSSAEEALKTLAQSEKSLSATINDMHQIQERMATISESIIQLSEHSQAIGKIIDTVNDLAEQSNLLAVNAAIEAAKAGDQGKGFAVVADEVRRLAEQSKQATIQVHAILNDIQNSTSSAVMATEQGTKAVSKGVEQSIRTNEALRLLTGGIDKVNQAATQISISSQQQLIGVGQVNVAMTNIREASQQHVNHMRQIETAVHGLNQVGQSLKELVEQYKV